MKLLHVVIVVAALSVCASAQAQVLGPPRRPARPPAGSTADPNRTQQTLTFGFDLLGGYDDNLSPEGGGASAEFVPRPSGYTGLSSASLAYSIGQRARALEVDGHSYMNTYRNIGVTPSYGGEISARARTAIGRRGQADIRQSVRYDPFFSLGAFSVLPAETGGQAFDSNPTNGIAESRSWTSDTAVSISHRWTQRTGIQVDYGFNKRANKGGAAFDSRTHAGGVAYDRSFSRSTGLRASYRRSNIRSIDFENNVRPVQDDTADLGLRYGRDLSRTRRVSFSAGAGAAHVDTVDEVTREGLTYWAPSGYTTAQFDLGRSWAILGNYRRGVSVLQGLTPQPFVTDATNLSVGGFLAAGTDATLTAGSSSGQTGGQRDLSGRFRSYTVTGQLRFAITQWWSAVFNYTRYKYKLDETASRALGVSPEMDRNAVRIGFTMTLPLVGGR
jgi:hypothetical protein